METFRLVCRDARGEWYMHDEQSATALAAYESASAGGRSPHVIVPDRLGRTATNAVVQRWKQGGAEMGDCLHCGYALDGLVRAADGLVICPECGVGAILAILPPRGNAVPPLILRAVRPEPFPGPENPAPAPT